MVIIAVYVCSVNYALSRLSEYWHQRADERHGNPPPKVTRSYYWSKTKVGRPPGELGVSKPMECDIFPFSADIVGWVTGRASGL